MGFLDKLTGTRRPEGDTPQRPLEELRAALLAVAAPDKPWRIREGEGDEADLVAEWRIDEPEWTTTFSRKKVDSLISVLMRFDEAEGEVRSVDKTHKVTWRSGVAHLSVVKEVSRGQSTQKKWRGTLGSDGLEETWSLDTDELKDALRDATTGAGWAWKGVVFGKL